MFILLRSYDKAKMDEKIKQFTTFFMNYNLKYGHNWRDTNDLEFRSANKLWIMENQNTSIKYQESLVGKMKFKCVFHFFALISFDTPFSHIQYSNDPTNPLITRINEIWNNTQVLQTEIDFGRFDALEGERFIALVMPISIFSFLFVVFCVSGSKGPIPSNQSMHLTSYFNIFMLFSLIFRLK